MTITRIMIIAVVVVTRIMTIKMIIPGVSTASCLTRSSPSLKLFLRISGGSKIIN